MRTFLWKKFSVVPILCLFTRPASHRFCQRHLWSFWRILTLCVNITTGMHWTHFKPVRKTVTSALRVNRPLVVAKTIEDVRVRFRWVWMCPKKRFVLTCAIGRESFVRPVRALRHSITLLLQGDTTSSPADKLSHPACIIHACKTQWKFPLIVCVTVGPAFNE